MSCRRRRSAILDILFLAIIIVFLFGLYNYMFASVSVIGISMESTLHNGDRVLVYKMGKPDYGDIVVFNSHLVSEAGERYFVKRVIGLPGDEISINYDSDEDNYFVWRNGIRLDEGQINSSSPIASEMPSVTVAEGYFFFLGDNRGESSDSRTGLMGRLDSISGRVVARYSLKGSKPDFELIKRTP